jgi:hypothetical protein
MDGHLTFEEFQKCLEMAKGTCKEVYEIQKEALRRRYSVSQDEPEEEDSGSKGGS